MAELKKQYKLSRAGKLWFLTDGQQTIALPPDIRKNDSLELHGTFLITETEATYEICYEDGNISLKEIHVAGIDSLSKPSADNKAIRPETVGVLSEEKTPKNDIPETATAPTAKESEIATFNLIQENALYEPYVSDSDEKKNDANKRELQPKFIKPARDAALDSQGEISGRKRLDELGSTAHKDVDAVEGIKEETSALTDLQSSTEYMSREVYIGTVKLYAQLGRLTELPGDCMVYLWSRKQLPEVDVMSHPLLSRVGNEIKQQWIKHRASTEKYHTFSTLGGNLDVSFIVHVMCNDSPRGLVQGFTEGLMMADQQQTKSLVIPFQAGHPFLCHKDKLASSLLSAVTRLTTPLVHVNDVSIIVEEKSGTFPSVCKPFNSYKEEVCTDVAKPKQRLDETRSESSNTCVSAGGSIPKGDNVDLQSRMQRPQLPLAANSSKHEKAKCTDVGTPGQRLDETRSESSNTCVSAGGGIPNVDLQSRMQQPQLPLPAITRFDVDVQTTPLAILCGIVGKKVLLISGNDMAFEDRTSKLITYPFQLKWLRRFGILKSRASRGVLAFEVGRKCPHGEGTIHLKSENNRAIYDLLVKESGSERQTVPTVNTKSSAMSSAKATQKESDLKSGIGLGEPSSSKVTRFDVDIQKTLLAMLFGIVGKKVLLVSGTDLAFEDPSSKYITYTFPMAWLHRFDVQDGLLTFEVGRKCPNGKGIISCKSEQKERIADMIDGVMPRNASLSEEKTAQHVNLLPTALTTTSNTTPITGVDVDNDPIYPGYEDPHLVLARMQNDEVAKGISVKPQMTKDDVDDDQLYCYAET